MDSHEHQVSLRPLHERDAEVIAAWGADMQFCREAGWSIGMSLAERQQAQRRLVLDPPKDLIRLGTVLDGDLVGYVDLHGDEPDRRELGFVIGERTRWGLGIGHMAAAAALDYAFDHLGLSHVWAEALEANQRSVRILRGLGMAEAGLGEHDLFLDQPSRYRRFSIAVEDWPGSRAS